MTMRNRYEPITVTPDQAHRTVVADPPAVKRVTIAARVHNDATALAYANDKLTAAIDDPLDDVAIG
ncbi:MAG: hypothetical protein ACLQA5_06005 [Solirubrobacteraceae bacterium]